jgi:hypothetical protein
LRRAARGCGILAQRMAATADFIDNRGGLRISFRRDTRRADEEDSRACAPLLPL